MANIKAYLESIARSFGYYMGKDKKVQVNTISQSPTLTTAGQGVKGLDGFLNYAENFSTWKCYRQRVCRLYRDDVLRFYS